MSKLVTVEGQVVVKQSGGLVVEHYEREFELDDGIGSEAEARSLIRKALIEPELRKSVDNFRRVRTMQVVSMADKKGKKESATELEKVVQEAVKLGCMPDSLEMYGDQASKVEAVKRAIKKKKEHDKTADKPKPDANGVADLGYID